METHHNRHGAKAPKVMKMLILGIDPGYANLGYAVVLVNNDQPILLSCGLLRTLQRKGLPKNMADEMRIRTLYRGLRNLTYPVHPSQKEQDKERSPLKRKAFKEGLIYRPVLQDIDVMCVEEMSWGMRSTTTHRQLGFSWGLLISLSEENQMPLKQVPIKVIKHVATGSYKASKNEVKQALLQKSNCKEVLQNTLDKHLVSGHEHICDAVASALALTAAKETL